jgi:periplasmic glucans biosynthesis protein
MPCWRQTKEAYRLAVRLSRWSLLCLAVSVLRFAAAAEAPAPAAPGGSAFSFEVLRQRARELATKDYHPEPGPELPDFLKSLTFDQYQDIRFRPEEAPWAKEHLPFGVQFFHRGFIYQEPVRIHLVEDGQVREAQFSAGQFDYGKNKFPKPVPAGLHYAGVRIVFNPEGTAKPDEVASFVGASYFRLVGLHQRYGAAGRGLTVDTGEPGGEEFPRFSEFWIEKPAESASTLRLFALLESPSAAGAYRFVIHPGENTLAEVEASVFVRKAGKKLGFAPLTSMFLMGENRTRFIADYRPEVHDSDGLLLEGSTGEWLWRPLVNPEKKHHISRFPADDPPGFGLLQRDRDFHNYEDLGARYDLRPSLWVKPLNQWGSGAVELVEIPSPAEWNDNIVAYWVPRQAPSPGQEFHLSYSLTATLAEPEPPSRLQVQATRINPAQDKSPPRILVDFAGPTVPPVAAGVAVEAKAQASHGEVRNLVTQPNEVTGGRRTFFDLAGLGTEPAELRLWLQSSNQPVSETWVYHFQNP